MNAAELDPKLGAPEGSLSIRFLGAFLCSSMDLETAVRQKLNITVLIFRDGGYNWSPFSRSFFTDVPQAQIFGNPDFLKYAESLGCVGLRFNTPDELLPIMRRALETPEWSWSDSNGLQHERRNSRARDSRSLGLIA